MVYEWDPQKAAASLRKHKVGFPEAASVFLDRFAITFSDPDHSYEEDREITIGVSSRQRALFVSHCARGGRIRIISVRKATRKERLQYEQRTDKEAR